MRRVLLALTAVALATAVAACGASPEPTPRPTLAPTVMPTSPSVPTPVPTAEPMSLDGPTCPDAFEQEETITREFDLVPGQALTISLGSTPSIPCGWRSPQISDSDVLTQTDHQSIWPAEDVTPMPGAPGTEVWAFRALKGGEAELSVACMCLDDDGDESLMEGRYVVRVTVQE